MAIAALRIPTSSTLSPKFPGTNLRGSERYPSPASTSTWGRQLSPAVPFELSTQHFTSAEWDRYWNNATATLRSAFEELNGGHPITADVVNGHSGVAFLLRLAIRESGIDLAVCNAFAFCGLIQFGIPALVDAGYMKPPAGGAYPATFAERMDYLNNAANWVKSGPWSAFQNDAAAQVDAAQKFLDKTYGYIAPEVRSLVGQNVTLTIASSVTGAQLENLRALPGYNAATNTITMLVTASGLLAAAHLNGATRISSMLTTRNITPDMFDETNTTPLDYMVNYGGYDLPFDRATVSAKPCVGSSYPQGTCVSTQISYESGRNETLNQFAVSPGGQQFSQSDLNVYAAAFATATAIGLSLGSGPVRFEAISAAGVHVYSIVVYTEKLTADQRDALVNLMNATVPEGQVAVIFPTPSYGYTPTPAPSPYTPTPTPYSSDAPTPSSNACPTWKDYVLAFGGAAVGTASTLLFQACRRPRPSVEPADTRFTAVAPSRSAKPPIAPRSAWTNEAKSGETSAAQIGEPRRRRDAPAPSASLQHAREPQDRQIPSSKPQRPSHSHAVQRHQRPPRPATPQTSDGETSDPERAETKPLSPKKPL